jgi:hypothetical protein
MIYKEEVEGELICDLYLEHIFVGGEHLKWFCAA